MIRHVSAPLKNVCALILLSACAAPQAVRTPHVSYVALDTGGVSALVTNAFGGRVAAFGVEDYPSVVKFDMDLAAADPRPPVDPAHAAAPYMGATVWAGPQSDWWNHQSDHPELAGQGWPPDPYVSLVEMAGEMAGETDGNRVTLTGPESPVSGLQLRKEFALSDLGCLTVTAEATNIRDEPVSWDLWNVIRVQPDAWVFAPVGGDEDVRYTPPNRPEFQPPRLSVGDGLAYADPSLAGVTAPRREGKAFLTPSEGWMAGFVDGQVFLVTFDLLPESAIHPEQGQVEFYFSQAPGDPASSVIEMETHAAYRTLAPGETMTATQYWLVAPYDGAWDKASLVAFVRHRLLATDACGTH
ncbi:MAG: DUF4380 domain-containing protein [Hyphomonas sp.]|nr:DUF4380 domain-containing protein [Hyphomonas sp.]MCB9970297.1 DUF4380 domain-containing protein [Hyphomonas sp.]